MACLYNYSFYSPKCFIHDVIVDEHHPILVTIYNIQKKLCACIIYDLPIEFVFKNCVFYTLFNPLILKCCYLGHNMDILRFYPKNTTHFVLLKTI